MKEVSNLRPRPIYEIQKTRENFLVIRVKNYVMIRI